MLQLNEPVLATVDTIYRGGGMVKCDAYYQVIPFAAKDVLGEAAFLIKHQQLWCVIIQQYVEGKVILVAKSLSNSYHTTYEHHLVHQHQYKPVNQVYEKSKQYEVWFERDDGVVYDLQAGDRLGVVVTLNHIPSPSVCVRDIDTNEYFYAVYEVFDEGTNQFVPFESLMKEMPVVFRLHSDVPNGMSFLQPAYEFEDYSPYA